MADLFGAPLVTSPTADAARQFDPERDATRESGSRFVENAPPVEPQMSRERFSLPGAYAATAANSFVGGTIPFLNSAIYGTGKNLKDFFFRFDGSEPTGFLQNYKDSFNISQDYFQNAREDLATLGGEEQTFGGNFLVGMADAQGAMTGVTTRIAGQAGTALARLAGQRTGAMTREQVDELQRFTTKLGEGISKYTPLEALDNYLLGWQSYGNSITQRGWRVLMSGVAATGPGVMQDIAMGNIDASDEYEVWGSILTNGVFGAGGQLILGETIMPLLNVASSRSEATKVVNDMLQRLPAEKLEGATPQSLRRMLQTIEPGNTMFDMRDPNGELLAANDALFRVLNNTVLPEVRPNQVNELDRKVYLSRVGNAYQGALNAVDASQETIDAAFKEVFGNAPSRRDVMARVRSDQADLTPVFEDMTRTRPANPGDPPPLGAQLINRRAFQQGVRLRFEQDARITLGEGPTANDKVWNVFTQALVPDTSLTGQQYGPNDLSPDGAPREIPLATLLTRGRAAVANAIKPQLNDTFTAADRVAATKLLRAIDAQIATTELGTLPAEARRQWSQSMMIADAYDLGGAYMTGRFQNGMYDLTDRTAGNMNTPTYATNLEEYFNVLRNMEGGEAAIQAFRDGARHSLGGYIETHTPGAALNVLLGHVDLDNQGNVYLNSRPGQEQILREVIGVDETNLLKSAADEQRLLEARNAAVAWFEQARVTGGAEVSRDAVNALVVHGLNGKGSRLGSMAQMISRFSDGIYGDGGLTSASERMDIITSPNGPRTVENILVQMEAPEVRVGASAGLVGDEWFDRGVENLQEEAEDARAVAEDMQLGPSFFASPEEEDEQPN